MNFNLELYPFCLFVNTITSFSHRLIFCAYRLCPRGTYPNACVKLHEYNTCIHVHMNTHLLTHTDTVILVHTPLCMCIISCGQHLPHKHVHMYTHTHIHTHTHAHTHPHTHTHTYTHQYTHRHMHIQTTGTHCHVGSHNIMHVYIS